MGRSGRLVTAGRALMRTFFLAAAFLGSAAPACAGHFGGVEEWSLYPSFQYFTWEEFRDTGTRILKEDGLLVGAGGTVRLDLYDKKLMLKTKAELFGGDVAYNGQTQQLPNLPSPPNPPNTPDPQSERPVKTDVIYFGVKAEADVGWRVPAGGLAVEPFAGLGYRWWLRSLENSTSLDANGVPFTVGGYTEYWTSFYGRLGARLTYRAGRDFSMFAEGGGKYPFYNENVADYPGTGEISIKPGREWSGFAEIGATYKRFRPSLYYEGFRFSASPTVAAFSTIENRVIGLLQPRSASDIFGVNLSWVFD